MGRRLPCRRDACAGLDGFGTDDAGAAERDPAAARANYVGGRGTVADVFDDTAPLDDLDDLDDPAADDDHDHDDDTAADDHHDGANDDYDHDADHNHDADLDDHNDHDDHDGAGPHDHDRRLTSALAAP
jgi:hypothetical protein